MKTDFSLRGFLKENFRVFHLKDKLGEAVDYHYHEFDKIVITLSDGVRYVVEGRTYYLKPWDLLFVRHGQIHRPLASPNIAYERIVIWVNPDYLTRFNTEDMDLSACFNMSETTGSSLFRPSSEQKLDLIKREAELESEMCSDPQGRDIAVQCAFLRFMVEIGRKTMLGGGATVGYKADSKVERILQYINENLNADLSIDALSAKFFISKYYFMRRFKESTGYTVHNYIIQKRLIRAAELIAGGQPAAYAAEEAGFSDYSVFLRAFRKNFGVSPREFAAKRLICDTFAIE